MKKNYKTQCIQKKLFINRKKLNMLTLLKVYNPVLIYSIFILLSYLLKQFQLLIYYNYNLLNS